MGDGASKGKRANKTANAGRPGIRKLGLGPLSWIGGFSGRGHMYGQIPFFLNRKCAGLEREHVRTK